MKVRDILAHKGRDVVTVRPDASVSTLVHRLALERIGALVVSEDGVRIQGIVSERDIIQTLAERGEDTLRPELHVADIMTRHVVTCTEDDSVKDVMGIMTRSRIRHLPVVDGGRLAGLVSIGDVVKNRVEEVELEATVLREYIHMH
ncbi:MAG: CBS domain-containing protein [Geminicoccaceae bacterium]